MALDALDDLTDAFEATKAFLLPFDAGQWAKLAVVVFFLGGTLGSGGSSGGSDGNAGDPGTGGGVSGDGVDFSFSVDGTGSTPGEAIESALGEVGAELTGIVVAVLLLVVLVGFAFLFVGSVMEFVFVESLRKEAVSIRAYWREHFGRGVRLFAFRLVFFLVAAAIFVGLFLLVLGPLFFGGITDSVTAGLSVLVFLALVPVLLILGLLAAVVQEFTTVFVVPIMMREDRGVLSAWGRLWGLVRADGVEFLAYAGLKLVLAITAGAVVGFVIAIPALVLLVPFAVLGGVSFLATGGNAVVGIVAVVVLGGLYLLLLLALIAVVRVPVVTYFRYYGLLLLGDIDEDLDLIPERRTAIRADGSGGSPREGDGDDEGSQESDGDEGSGRDGEDDGGWGSDGEWGR